MTNPTFNITQEQLQDLTESIEDMVAYFCDENMVSGETAWIVTECLAITKTAQLRGEIK